MASLKEMLTTEEKNLLRGKLREMKKIDLQLICYRLCPDSVVNNNKLEKEDFIAKLMVYGLKHPNAPDYLPYFGELE